MHNVVAGIYAQGTVNASQLSSVAYIDTRWANLHAEFAVDAVTFRGFALDDG